MDYKLFLRINDKEFKLEYDYSLKRNRSRSVLIERKKNTADISTSIFLYYLCKDDVEIMNNNTYQHFSKMSASDLASALGIPKTTIVDSLRRLMDAGYIQKFRESFKEHKKRTIDSGGKGRPKTFFRISEEGKEELKKRIFSLDNVIEEFITA